MNFLKYGFKLTGTMFIYFSLVILGAFLGFLGFSLSPTFAVIGLIVMGVGIILGIPLGILAEGVFFDTFTFKDTLDYKKVCRLLSKVKMEVGVYFLICICFMMLTSMCNSIVAALGFTIIFAAVFMTIGQLVIVNISAQIYKLAKTRLG
jgi:hypothetical protein